MTRFARKGHTVRWVETRYLAWLAGRTGEFLRARREQPLENLAVRPVTLVNGERFGPIRAHNKYWLTRALNAPTPGAEGPRILWLYSPHEGHLADRVAHDLLIYDIMDEYRGFPWSPPRIAEEEADLLARADWVFAGTGALHDAKREQAAGRIECILSGVDLVHFSNPDRLDDPQHEALRRRHDMLIGYAGMVDLRIDQALLERVADRRPKWGFVLLGPIACNVAQLRNSPNVYLLGPKSYDALPAYYNAWDAAMLPMVDNELTRHINPTKMLEYAAAGRPILARALPDVERFYAEGAWLYRTAEQFEAHLDFLENAHPRDVEENLTTAHAWAADRSWNALADRMLERIESLVQRRDKKSG